MNRLKVALQGVGFGRKLLALQGFGDSDTEVVTDDNYGIVLRPVKEKKPKKDVIRKDTDDDVLFAFLLG